MIEEQKAVNNLVRLLWKVKLMEEIQSVHGYYFRPNDLFDTRREKPVTKAAINSTVSFLNSLKVLDDLWVSSPLRTGGIVLVQDNDKTPNNIIVTERGTILRAENDIKKYMEFNKL